MRLFFRGEFGRRLLGRDWQCCRARARGPYAGFFAGWSAEGSFGVEAVLPQGLAAPGWAKIALFAVALVLVFRLRLRMLSLVGFGVAAGLALHGAGLD